MIRPVLAAVCGLLFFAPAAQGQAIRTLNLTANDLAYSPLTGRLYASIGASGEITEIDPVTGTVGVSFPVGSQPNTLAVSDGGDYLYVGLDGLPGVVRVHLPTRTVGTPFTLGPPDPIFGARVAEDLAIMPGNPDAVAVARRFNVLGANHAGVALYDSGVARATVTPNGIGSNRIAFGASAARLFGYDAASSDFGFRRMDVDASGVTILENTPGLLDNSRDFRFLGGRVFGSNGQVVDAEARTLLGTLPDLDRSPADATNGVPFPLVEPTAARVYALLAPDLTTWLLRAHHPATLAVTDQWVIPGVTGTPATLVSLGSVGLAFSTATQVFLIAPSLLPQGAPLLTITSPTGESIAGHDAMSVTLSGVASDADGTIAAVSWSTSQGYSGVASGTTAWFASDIPLVLGDNLITVTAVDNDGHAGIDTLFLRTVTYESVLAEGATGDFFDYDLALANPTTNSVPVSLAFLRPAESAVIQVVTLPPQSRRTIRVDEIAGLSATTMSTQARASAPIVVERTMRWGTAGGPQYGAHGDKATTGAATTWYFAEGSQGFFFTYLLLANTTSVANTAAIDWLIEGGSPVHRTVSLPPNSRTTIDAGADAALVGHSFGIVVTFAQPAVAERAMYFGAPPDVLFKAGHDSAGVTAPSTRWILAEGATGPFFETFILLANPNAAAATATLRFLTSTGVAVDRTVTIAAGGRRTVNLEALEPAAPELANAAVSTLVTSSLPIVAERAQYWPGPPSDWYEAHNSFGLTAARTRWGLGEGRVGNPAGVPPADYQTYILLANPGTTAASVTITFLRETGAPVVRTFTVAPERRFNVAVAGPLSNVPELADEMFGALIESTQPIVVERALYGNAGAQVFGLGTNATGTPLP